MSFSQYSSGQQSRHEQLTGQKSDCLIPKTKELCVWLNERMTGHRCSTAAKVRNAIAIYSECKSHTIRYGRSVVQVMDIRLICHMLSTPVHNALAVLFPVWVIIRWTGLASIRRTIREEARLIRLTEFVTALFQIRVRAAAGCRDHRAPAAHVFSVRFQGLLCCDERGIVRDLLSKAAENWRLCQSRTKGQHWNGFGKIIGGTPLIHKLSN